MRAVVQRVKEASVTVAGERVSKVGAGLLVLVGVGRGDGETDVQFLADKIAEVRVFPDDAGQMNRSARDAAAEILVVSQFTLYGDCRKGRRPSYSEAAPPEEAERLYRDLVARLKATGLVVREGVFRAMMDVALVNDGPVTLLLDSRRTF